MNKIHGEQLMTGRSLGLRMFGAALSASCLYHYLLAGLDSVAHTVGTLVLFMFGAYLMIPEIVTGFLGGLARVLPWGKQ